MLEFYRPVCDFSVIEVLASSHQVILYCVAVIIEILLILHHAQLLAAYRADLLGVDVGFHPSQSLVSQTALVSRLMLARSRNRMMDFWQL